MWDTVMVGEEDREGGGVGDLNPDLEVKGLLETELVMELEGVAVEAMEGVPPSRLVEGLPE